jgi:hypothetical protein
MVNLGKEMKFAAYWMICIAFAAWAAMEKILADVRHQSHMWYWILIGFSVFSWLCAYGTRIEDKENSKDNPF